jgi:uncharacterized protein YqjF (DUF2071 family)
MTARAGSMTWNDLLFMHWPVKESALRTLVPAALDIDLFDGSAWIGVIPFYMTNVRPRLFPRALALRFAELNVRTYVRHRGRSGVWFFSLDAASRLAVWAARRFYYLPYEFAEMSTASAGDRVEYRSRRASAPAVELVCRYRAVGSPFHAGAGSLDSWLTDRDCLFAANREGAIFRGDIHHEPWPLQRAEVEIEANTMVSPLGLTLPPDRPVLHFAKRLDVDAWSLVRSAG